MDTADESVLTDISANDQHQDLECHDPGAEVNAFFVSTRLLGFTEVIRVEWTSYHSSTAFSLPVFRIQVLRISAAIFSDALISGDFDL